MSPIGSYVGGLTSKGQVGVLLGEHRGWILRMAALIKGRLSDTKTFQVFFQTSDRKPLRLPFRTKEFRTFACFLMFWSVSGRQPAFFPITFHKNQAPAHRFWIQHVSGRMFSLLYLCTGRQSDSGYLSTVHLQ